MKIKNGKALNKQEAKKRRYQMNEEQNRRDEVTEPLLKMRKDARLQTVKQ